MKIINFIFFCLGIIYCDVLRPKDDFNDINLEEDMGVCIGIQGNSSNMTQFEQFQAFNSHNCLPFVVLEGMEASKLQLLITDCDALTDDVLANCNIMTEKNKHRFIWFQPPGLVKCQSNVTEFMVWVSLVGDPVSWLGGGKCLNTLFGTQLDYLKPYFGLEPLYILPDQPGVTITWYGNTPQTLNSSQCGVTAGEDLGSFDVPIDEFMDFQAFYDYTIGMGYQPGLTMLPIPYDWRRMAGNHEATTTLQRTIEYANTITGKKVVIIAHSFGCLAFLTIMSSLPQSFKDQYIDSFFGIGCAWTGSMQALSTLVAGQNLGWWEFGYPFSDTRSLVTTLTALFDLQPKGIFNTSTQWGYLINQRAQQEANWNSSNPPKNISFGWFPTPQSNCYFDRSSDVQCGFHIYNFFSNILAQTPNATFMLNDSSIQSILEQYMVRTDEELAFQQLVNSGKVSQQEQEQTWGTKQLIPKDRVSLILQMAKRNGAQNMINPGINIHHLYGGHCLTDTWYNIYNNPRTETDQGNVASNKTIKINQHWGDAVVNIDNGIVPSLKWAWEFDNGVENAKPVHMIDYCSNYSQLMYKDSTGKYTTQFQNITKNTYNGIMCKNLQHPELPNDEFIDKYIAALLKSGAPGQPIYNLTESDVNLIVQTCPHIMAPWNFQNFSSLYSYGVNPQNMQQNKANYDYPFSQSSQQFIAFLEQYYAQIPQGDGIQKQVKQK